MATTITHAYTIYGVDFDFAGATQVVLNGIQQTPLDFGATTGGAPHSGNVYPNCLFLSDMRPVGSIVTQNILTAFTVMGVEGVPITSDGDEFGCVLYAQRLDKFGKRGATGHKAYRVNKGLVIPRTLTASRDSSSLSFDVIAVEDAGADPVIIVEGVTLPTLPITENHYVLDKVVVAGVTLGGPTDISLDFGVNVDIDKSGGRIFPNWAHKATITPRMTINGFDVDWIRPNATPIDKFGGPATVANTAIYLKKRECGATFYADNANEHLKLTMIGRVQPQSTLGGDPKVNASLQLVGHHDGTNFPISILTGEAIPA